MGARHLVGPVGDNGRTGGGDGSRGRGVQGRRTGLGPTDRGTGLPGTGVGQECEVGLGNRVERDLDRRLSVTTPWRVQPAGVVAVAVRAVDTNITSSSPATTVVGTCTLARVTLLFIVRTARNAICDGGASETVTVEVVLPDAPWSSVTVSVTG